MSINSEDLLVNQRNKGTSERESIIMIKKKREKTALHGDSAKRYNPYRCLDGTIQISDGHKKVEWYMFII